MRVVISGAGAAAIACTNLYRNMGVKFENIAMFDSKGHINKSRTDLNEFKQQYATEKAYDSLAEAMVGADCFLGLSKAGVVSKEMVKSMSDNCPIIFACANPDPEITYDDAKEARPDCIMGTGRSDFPNQVNNVLGFPFIFRGALDCGATSITEGMKLAAAQALADLAKTEAPKYVCEAFGVDKLEFGSDYVIPKALDLRLIEYVSVAVAKAAMEEGVARKQLNLDEYKASLGKRIAESGKRVSAFVETYHLGI
jgi:malate dehydrogenase (oxaloacetate-decarboxylating)(NADP+)